MTCRDFADFIDSYLAHDLAAEAIVRFEHHLSVCPNCQRYLAQYRDAIRFGRNAFAHSTDTVPPDVPEDLVSAILAARAVH